MIINGNVSVSNSQGLLFTDKLSICEIKGTLSSSGGGTIECNGRLTVRDNIAISSKLITERRHLFKPICANVDFYSGFVYNMLDIPLELFTPIFAVARIVGWSAHRLEELINVDKIIRPAYKSLVTEREYVDIDSRE